MIALNNTGRFNLRNLKQLLQTHKSFQHVQNLHGLTDGMIGTCQNPHCIGLAGAGEQVPFPVTQNTPEKQHLIFTRLQSGSGSS